MRHPANRVDGAKAVLRTWFNDGADGESAHVVCDAVEDLRARNIKLEWVLQRLVTVCTDWHTDDMRAAIDEARATLQEGGE